jgi:hypothetical protein
LSKDQLAGIGAVAMAWNDVESALDHLVGIALGLDYRIANELTTRLDNFDAKSELIKRAIASKLVALGDQLSDGLRETLGVAKTLKTYRDAVIHARAIDPARSMGRLRRRQGQFEVLLSEQALDGLYDRLVCVRNELRKFAQIGMELKRKATHGPRGQQLAAVLQEHVAQLQEHRRARLSLPPLPGFQA